MALAGDLKLPNEFRASLGAEMKMDTHWIDVRLRSGRRVKNVVVRGGSVLTGVETPAGSLTPLDFSPDEIMSVARHQTGLPRLLVLIAALIGLVAIAAWYAARSDVV
jgi:hypothetical protein